MVILVQILLNGLKRKLIPTEDKINSTLKYGRFAKKIKRNPKIEFRFIICVNKKSATFYSDNFIVEFTCSAGLLIYLFCSIFGERML